MPEEVCFGARRQPRRSGEVKHQDGRRVDRNEEGSEWVKESWQDAAANPSKMEDKHEIRYERKGN